MTKVRHYIVRGRVQGVGFRWLVHREAGTRDLKGWVRNTDEGEVEIMVAGSEEKLAELRAVLERGSRGSRVDAVLEKDMEETMATGLESFRIEGAW
jgi:acylphosphatase